MELVDLESSGVIRILRYMLDHPEGTQKVDLRSKIGLVSNTAIKAHSLLFENKLITLFPSEKQLLFVLTEKGKEIATHLKQIDQLLKENEPKEFTGFEKEGKYYIIKQDGTKMEVQLLQKYKDKKN